MTWFKCQEAMQFSLTGESLVSLKAFQIMAQCSIKIQNRLLNGLTFDFKVVCDGVLAVHILRIAGIICRVAHF